MYIFLCEKCLFLSSSFTLARKRRLRERVLIGPWLATIWPVFIARQDIRAISLPCPIVLFNNLTKTRAELRPDLAQSSIDTAPTSVPKRQGITSQSHKLSSRTTLRLWRRSSFSASHRLKHWRRRWNIIARSSSIMQDMPTKSGDVAINYSCIRVILVLYSISLIRWANCSWQVFKAVQERFQILILLALGSLLNNHVNSIVPHVTFSGDHSVSYYPRNILAAPPGIFLLQSFSVRIHKCPGVNLCPLGSKEQPSLMNLICQVFLSLW